MINEAVEQLKKKIREEESYYNNGVMSLDYAFEMFDKVFEMGKEEGRKEAQKLVHEVTKKVIKG